MQFVRGGPDVPERLLQAHEEGRVVFFCGAGVSYPAGLPGFGGLVDRIFKGLGVTPSDLEKAASKSGAFDTSIAQLEARMPGGRPVVRRELARQLKPNLANAGALETHDALLTLARTTDGHCRIVTTNFDRLFEEVRPKHGSPLIYSAPMLPIPKAKWNGI